MKINGNLKKLASAAVMTALICVLTAAVRIPSPVTGDLNLGDSAVLFAGWFLGPLYGAAAAGIGSAFADLLAGWPVYIPGTAVIKALMAVTVALVRSFPRERGRKGSRARLIAGSAAAEAIMVSGYLTYEAAFMGEGFAAALSGVPGNALQGAVGIAGALLLTAAAERTGAVRPFGGTGR